MSRWAVGLLAAIGTTMSVLAGLIHGHLEPLVTACAGLSSGLAAYLALPPSKKKCLTTYRVNVSGRYISGAEPLKAGAPSGVAWL
jgi:hypothetical protein